jgi:hypothetical protein
VRASRGECRFLFAKPAHDLIHEHRQWLYGVDDEVRFGDRIGRFGFREEGLHAFPGRCVVGGQAEDFARLDPRSPRRLVAAVAFDNQ